MWLIDWPLHPAFLGSEQRESNGCAAMAGPRHELRSGWGSKANQQVIKTLLVCTWLFFSFSIRSYVLKEIVGPRQKSRASEKEVWHFAKILATLCCISFKSNDWQNDRTTSLYHLSARTVEILQLTDVSTCGQWPASGFLMFHQNWSNRLKLTLKLLQFFKCCFHDNTRHWGFLFHSAQRPCSSKN